jgi:hypothetical protein
MGKSSPSAPPPPDYEAQAKAGKVNQVGPQGTKTWSKGADGIWTETTDAGDAGKNYQAQQAGLLRMSDAATGALPGAIDKSLTGLDTSSLPGWKNFDMSPTGNSKDIQDATYALMQPQLQQGRDSEIQRLKNQGITEDSPAFQRAMLTLDQGDNDAKIKALIAGTTEYGNSFNRNTQASTLSNALRGQMLGEQSNVNNYDLNQVKSLFNFGQGGGGGLGPDGATNDGGAAAAAMNNTYKAQMDQYNASQANAGSAGAGLGGLLGAGAGFLMGGGPAGMQLGATLGSGVGRGLLR